MPDLETMLAFSVVTLVLVATPGPGVLYVVGRSSDRGRRAGFASMLGIESAELVYLLAAATGLSALLAASEAALGTLQYAGAAYLVVIGVREWRRKGGLAPSPASASRHLFLHGFLVQILNPKVALFFVAYFPQFLNPASAVTPQVLILGAIYILIASTSDTAYVLLASFAARRFVRSSRAQRRIARFSAATYIGLGVFAALSGQRTTTATRS
jgi:threonine/homoserine/homoserine lactone efflux protein